MPQGIRADELEGARSPDGAGAIGSEDLGATETVAPRRTADVGTAEGPRLTAAEAVDRILLGYTYPFVVIVVLSIAARAQAIVNPLYSPDGYALAYSRADLPELLLYQGRFAQAAFERLGDLLGFGGTDVRVAALLLAVLLYSHAGILFARVMADRPTNGAMVIFLALFALHPFSVEFFWFSETTLHMVMSVWVAAVGLYLSVSIKRALWAAAVGGTLIVLSLAMYQTVIAYILAVCALALSARIVRDGATATILRSHAMRGTIVAVICVPVYLALVRAISALTGVATDTRVSFTTVLDDPGQLVLALARAVRTALWPWPDTGFVSEASSVILLLVLMISVVAVVYAPLRSGRFWDAIICLGLIAGALVWAAGATQLSDSDWLAPRTLVAVTVVTAGSVMLAWDATRLAWLRLVIAGCVTILCVSYIGTSNRVLFEQRLVNTWDAHMVNRIIARLEARPGAEDATRMAVVGSSWPYTSELSTRFADFNGSALSKPWSRVGLLDQATGYRLMNASESEARLAEEYCSSVDPWPAPESAVVVGTVAIVCLQE